MTLSKEALQQRIEDGLITGYISLKHQLHENRFHLTVQSVHAITEAGQQDFSDSEQYIPATEELTPYKDTVEAEYGWWYLTPGAYIIYCNETINMPKDLSMCLYPRPAVLQAGAYATTADFSTNNTIFMSVYNQHGLYLKENARAIEVIFAKVNQR